MIPGMLDPEMVEDTAKKTIQGKKKEQYFSAIQAGVGSDLQSNGRNLQQAYFEDFTF